MTKLPRGPFRRSRRALVRLPLAPKLFAAAALGALTVLCTQALIPSNHRRLGSGELAMSPAHHVGIRKAEGRPRPIVVVAAGLPRTGSTWVYNVLRILMRMRDPNSVAGWYADLIAIWKNHKTGKYDHMKMSWLDAYKSLNTSVLLKMHGPGPFKLFSHGKRLEKGADLTVTTHRDLRTEVRSWVYQNWNASIHAGNISNTPFGDPAKWVQVADHILKEREATLGSIGEGTYLDIRYEDWTGKDVEEQLGVIRKMADELQSVFSDDDLRAAAMEAARLEPPASGAVLMYNPVNALHPGHTRVDTSNAEFQAALSRGYGAIEKDDRCNAFLDEKRYL